MEDLEAMVKLRFYGGVEGFIGGNQILLEDGDTKLLLDFGLNYRVWSNYFEFLFAEPRSLEEVSLAGLAPSLEELSGLDACLISHAHGDHWRMITVLPEDTRVLLGECAYRLVAGWARRVRRRTLLYRVSHLRFETFRTGVKLRFGDVEVKPFSVDHSIPGAYSFQIYTSSGLILYTGDFRVHGRFKPRRRFTEEVEDKVKLLVSEGTNVGRLVDPTGESDVEARTIDVLRRCRGLAVVDLAPADVDRVKTMVNVAAETGRKILATGRIADTLEDLSEDRILNPPRIGDEIERFDEETGREASVKPERYMVLTCFYSEREVRGLKPPPGSVYVLSCSEPFEEEREVAFNRLLSWLHLFGIPVYHIHSSGHVYPLDLRRIVEEVKPEATVAVHTEHPSAFRSLLSDLTRVYTPRIGGEVTLES